MLIRRWLKFFKMDH